MLRIARLLPVAAALLLAAGPVRAEPFLLGIDVSRWQGTIDWTAVAADPQRVSFVIARATAGRTYADERYETNRTGALTHGMAVLAYHFAYPDPEPGDAIAEADHFVEAAQLAGGLVVPALDLEGASLQYWPSATPSQLFAWTTAWLERVRARTGLQAMIYTNPSFWQTRFADTGAFARAGYPLWVAHWTSASAPTVPAANWAGDGWRCWQYTSQGRVDGIAGNVDMNRLDPASLRTSVLHALA